MKLTFFLVYHNDAMFASNINDCAIICNNGVVTGKNCIVAINKYKGEFHLIIYFKSAVVFIVPSTAGSSCCSLLYIFHIFVSNKKILHFFSIHSHCIFAINGHKGKWVIVLTNKTTIFVYHVEYRLFNQVLHFIAIWP